MGKCIRILVVQIPPNYKSLYITGFDPETEELTFRSSDAPEIEQKEIIELDEKGIAFTKQFNFDSLYISKFIELNL